MGFSFSDSGQVKTLSCLDFMDRVEDSMSFNYDFRMELTNFMGSPLIKSHLKWQHNEQLNKACITPYGEKESVEVVIQNKERRKIYPYQAKVLLKINSENYLSKKDIFLLLDPGVLSQDENEESYNTPSVKDWDKLFFELPKNYLNTQESIENNAIYLTTKEAEEFLSSKIRVTSMRTLEERFNLSELKLNYSEAAIEQRNERILTVSEKFFNWILSEFPSDPENLKGLLQRLGTLPLDEVIEKLTEVLEAVTSRSLQGSTYNPTDEQQRNYSTLQLEISTTLAQNSRHPISHRRALRLNKDEQRKIQDEIEEKQYLLQENQVDLTKGPRVLEEDTLVTLDCGNRSEEIYLKKGLELKSGISIGPLTNRSEPNWNGFQAGISDAILFNESIAYLCKKSWAEAELRVVDLKSKSLLIDKYPNQSQLNDYISNLYMLTSETRRTGFASITGDYLVSVKATLDKKVTIDIYDSKDQMKKESFHIDEAPMKIKYLHADKRKVLVTLHNYSKENQLKVIDLETNKVQTIRNLQDKFEVNSLTRYEIIDSKGGKYLVHQYQLEKFKRSLLIEDEEIVEIIDEKLEEIPND